MLKTMLHVILIVLQVHRAVTTRDAKFANFVEVGLSPHLPPPPHQSPPPSTLQYRTHKLIYRRYAGLFFTLCVDVNDTELVRARG